MWFVKAQYFCTSYSLLVSIRLSGFSCPSTMWVCSAEYTSEKLMLAGDAPKAWNMLVQSGLTGTRILNPFRSAGVAIGFVLLVVCRKPLSKIFSNTCRPRLPISARTNAPSLPSIAGQTWS